MEESFSIIQGMLENRNDSVTNSFFPGHPSHPPVCSFPSQKHEDPSAANPHTDYGKSGEEQTESEGVELATSSPDTINIVVASLREAGIVIPSEASQDVLARFST